MYKMKTLLTGSRFSIIGLGLGIVAGSIGYMYVSTRQDEKMKQGYFCAMAIVAGGFIGEAYGNMFDLY